MIYEHLLGAASPALILDQINHLTHLVSKCCLNAGKKASVATEYPPHLLVVEFGRTVLRGRLELTKPQRNNVLTTTWKAAMEVEEDAAFIEYVKETTALLNFTRKKYY